MVAFLATGVPDSAPPQPCIDLDEESEPSLLRITKVPQKAKAVLVEPVLLKIDNLNVLYTESPAVHVLQRPVPGKVAPVNVKSLEVHELAGGNVCANDFVEIKTNKTAMQILK